MCSDSPPAPNYQPLADASAESAKIMADLGYAQLDENASQYAQTQALLQPILSTQLANMQQTAAQGQDYYDYLKQYQRPAEIALFNEGMQAGSAEMQESAAARAMADMRAGTTQQQNQLIRQGLRYGWSPAKIQAMAQRAAGENASREAAGANAARERERNMGWAKKLDVAGLYRGLPGASAGAYSVSTNAGNSAAQNQLAASGQYMSGLYQGANTIGSGLEMQNQGLSSILGAQSSAYNAGVSNSGLDIGGLLQGGAALYSAF